MVWGGLGFTDWLSASSSTLSLWFAAGSPMQRWARRRSVAKRSPEGCSICSSCMRRVARAGEPVAGAAELLLLLPHVWKPLRNQVVLLLCQNQVLGRLPTGCSDFQEATKGQAFKGFHNLKLWRRTEEKRRVREGPNCVTVITWAHQAQPHHALEHLTHGMQDGGSAPSEILHFCALKTHLSYNVGTYKAPAAFPYTWRHVVPSTAEVSFPALLDTAKQFTPPLSCKWAHKIRISVIVLGCV